MTSTPLFYVYFTLPNVIGCISNIDSEVKKLLGVVSPHPNKSYFSLLHVADIIRENRRWAYEKSECMIEHVLSDHVLSNKPELRGTPLIEQDDLLDCLKEFRTPNARVENLITFFESHHHVLELPEKEGISELHPCMSYLGESFDDWVRQKIDKLL